MYVSSSIGSRPWSVTASFIVSKSDLMTLNWLRFRVINPLTESHAKPNKVLGASFVFVFSVFILLRSFSTANTYEQILLTFKRGVPDVRRNLNYDINIHTEKYKKFTFFHSGLDYVYEYLLRHVQNVTTSQQSASIVITADRRTLKILT